MEDEKTLKTTSELQDAVSDYQGITNNAVEKIEQPKIEQTDSSEQSQSGNYFVPIHDNFSNAITSRHSNAYTQEAIESGFSTSRYDSSYTPGMDVEHDRALQQSAWSKIGTGITKGLVTAGTTAVNTTVGTVYGIGAGLFELATDANGDGRGIMTALDAGTNNFITQQMANLQKWSEQAMPNYRTSEERSEKYQKEWWKHMATANFIGDSLLKNFGFTVGAMAGGAAWTKLIQKGLARKLSGDVLKGAVLSANGDATVSAEMKRALDAIQRGTLAAVDVDKLTPNLINIGRQLNKANAKLQLYGSAISAMGEGSFEGIMAKNEFLEDFNQKLNAQKLEEAENIEKELLSSNDERFVYSQIEILPNGAVQKVPYLTEEGKKELARRQGQLTGKYNNQRIAAEDESRRLATTTYLLNLPILTTSNMIQFGKMFSGGWKAQRAIAKSLKKTAGGYAARGTVASKSILETLKVMGSEGFEEMAQGTVSSGAKRVAEVNLTDFNDAGYDAAAIGSVRSWFTNMYNGGKDYLSDVKNWQEGALGAITGLLGIPGKHWHGGAIGAVQQAKEEVKVSREAANKLNNIVSSKDFQDRWRGYIRHLKYDDEMAAAAEGDNEYAYHTASSKQLINDIIAFADAGRLEDLNQMISSYENLTVENVADLRSMYAEAQDDATKNWAQNAADKEILDETKKRAKKITDEIAQYKSIYESIISRNPGASEKLVKELLFTTEQMKSFENRFLTLFGEVMNGIEPYLTATAIKESGETVDKKKLTADYERLCNMYEQLFSSPVSVAIPPELANSMSVALDELEKATEKNDASLAQKVKDLRKLSEARQEYFKKVQTLQEDDAEEKVEQTAITQDQVDEAAQQVLNVEETKGLDSVETIKQAFFDKNGAQERSDYINTLKNVADKNPAAKEFLALRKRYEEFTAYFHNHGYDNTDDITVTPSMTQGMLNDLFRLAKTESEFINLSDNIFPNRDQFNLANQSIFGMPSSTGYDTIKKQVKKAMLAYLNGSKTKVKGKDYLEAVVPEESLRDGATGPKRDAEQPGMPLAKPTGKEASNPFVAAILSIPDGSYIDPDILNQLDSSITRFVNSMKLEEDKTAQVYLEHLEENKYAFMDAAKSVKSVEELVQKLVDDTKDLTAEEKQILLNMLAFDEVGNKLWEYVPSAVDTQEEDDTVAVGEETEILAETVVQERPEELAETRQVEASKTDGMYTEYRTSVPEIETKEKNKAKDQIIAQAQATEAHKDKTIKYAFDLSDFVDNHPEYALFWNALSERGAFANATRVQRGTKIAFGIDPTFPKDPKSGEPKILVYALLNGEYKLVSMLSEQTRRYYGLRELREQIWAEYDIAFKINPSAQFVFSKQSSVLYLNKGLVNYDFTGALHKKIQDIPDFDDNVPVIYVRRKAGVPSDRVVYVKGTKNDNLTRKILSSNPDIKAGLYYIYNADAAEPALISLHTQQFREETKDSNYSTMQQIQSLLTDIASIVKDTKADTVEVQNTVMHEKLQELAQILDLHYVYFNIQDIKDVGLCLRINKKEPAAKENEWSQLFKVSDITESKLINFIASKHRHLNLGNETAIGSDTDQFKNNFTKLFDAGMICSAAERMRPKGVDFVYSHFDPTTKQFGDSSAIVSAVSSVEYKDDIAKAASTVDEDGAVVPVATESIDVTVKETENTETDATDITEVDSAKDETTNQQLAGSQWEDLPENIKQAAINQGFDGEFWNMTPSTDRLKILSCL